MGVLTTGVVPAGKVFGPVPANLTLSDPALLIGHMTCDNRPDIHTVKIDLAEAGGEARAGEWVPYVQPARDEREQNLEAYLKEGHLHYRATRTIAAGEELLIWYSKDMAAALGVPELMPFHIREGGVFFCPYCMETFRYPNSLRAHMRFKCEHRRQIHPMGLTGLSGLRPPGPIPRDVHERLFPALGFDYRTANIEKATHGAFPYPGYPNFSLSLPTPGAATAPLSSASSASSSSVVSAMSPVASEHLQGAMLHSPASSTTSSMGVSVDKHSPHSDRSLEGGRDGPWGSSRGSPGKRSLDEEDVDGLSAKRLAAEEVALRRGSPPPSSPQADIHPQLQQRPRSTDSGHSGESSPGRTHMHAHPAGSPPFNNNNNNNNNCNSSYSPTRSNGGEHLKLDRNQNINTSTELSDDENLSAFRKVEKRSDLSPELGSSSHHPTASLAESLYKMSPASLRPPSTLYSPTPINGLKAAGQPEKVFSSGLPHPSFLPRLALLPGNAGMPPAFFPPANAPYNTENLPLNMSDLYRNSLNTKFGGGGGMNGMNAGPISMVRSASDKLADIHNIENNSQYAKMMFLPTNPASAAAAAAMSLRMNPYYKSQNPMVEKLLTNTPVPRVPAPFSMNLTQNWCAKCNATFRMTSDLVYHMRSHHKEEPLVKKKREDKLKCTVCGETFRERHHLTRHMTSHQ